MTQPLDRSCRIAAQGAIDSAAGEFWVDNPFQMLVGQFNLSAFERNRFFLSQRGRNFVDLSHESGADLDSDSRSAVAADFDRDGATDLLVASVGGGPLRLFRNRIPSIAHRVRLELIGVKSNRAAVGARVVAVCGDQRIVRDLFPANGFMGQGPVELILGTGEARKIDRLSIRWPSGRTQEFADVQVDGTIQITEGKDTYSTAR